jgi:hypothetical protein
MSCQIKNNANLDLTDLQPHINGMYDHFHQKLGFQKPPVIVFDSDPSNESKVLGKTAYYDPQSFEVHVYTDGRHPKDMLRSIAHELIHHQQNLEGRLDVGGYNGPGYYLENDKMKKIEQEAMLQGNAILREYEDGLKLEEMNKMSLKEWKNNELNSLLLKKFGILKENKMVDEELTDKQEKNLPDNLKAAIEKKEAEEGEKKEEDLQEISSKREDFEHNREQGREGSQTQDDRLHEEEEEELDEGQLCEKCGGKHYMKEEEEIEERARGRERVPGGQADRDDERTRPMQESIKRSIRSTLKENRNIRLKIKR